MFSLCSNQVNCLLHPISRSTNFRESDDMDLSAIIRRAIEIGGDQRGFITFDEVNELMPSHMVEPKDIEALFEALREHGIDVREA
jgi:hypothetical protein